MTGGGRNMPSMKRVVVGLDLHLKRTQGTVMSIDGRILRQERFPTNKEALAEFLSGLPSGTQVALEAQGFCWSWIDYIEEVGHVPLLVNPIKAKQRAEDLKTDKLDSEVLAHLTRMRWLPTVYIPSKELRELRNLVRHRCYLRKLSTALKNRTWSEFRKRDLRPEANMKSIRGRKQLMSFGIHEIKQNLELIEATETKIKQTVALLRGCLANVEVIELLRTIPGIDLITATGMYVEICDIGRFSNPEKLAHYAGLVPRVHQSGEHTRHGRETKGNKWLKWLFIEAAWAHIRSHRDGRLAKVYRDALKRKRSKAKAIKIVARKLVNVVWAVWAGGQPFAPDKA
jgi:transposase